MPEDEQGKDLNEDGDRADLCLHVYDFAKDESTNLGLAVLGPHGSTGILPPCSAPGFPSVNSKLDVADVALSGGWLAFLVDEMSQNQELNDDDDREDAVLHVTDLATLETMNFGPLGGTYYDLAGNWLLSREAEGDVDEDRYRFTGLFNLESGEARRILLPSDYSGWSCRWSGAFSARWLVTWSDGWFYIHELASGETRKFPFEARPADLVVGEDLLAFSAPEWQESGGNESPKDSQLYLIDLSQLLALPRFLRGDGSGDGTVDISDAVGILNWLFVGGQTPSCLDAADTDDTGVVDLTDSVYLLSFLFLGGPPPVEPFEECGADLTVENPELGCVTYAPCPP